MTELFSLTVYFCIFRHHRHLPRLQLSRGAINIVDLIYIGLHVNHYHFVSPSSWQSFSVRWIQIMIRHQATFIISPVPLATFLSAPCIYAFTPFSTAIWHRIFTSFTLCAVPESWPWEVQRLTSRRLSAHKYTVSCRPTSCYPYQCHTMFFFANIFVKCTTLMWHTTSPHTSPITRVKLPRQIRTIQRYN